MTTSWNISLSLSLLEKGTEIELPAIAPAQTIRVSNPKALAVEKATVFCRRA
jgi:hypothetical protein